MTVGHDESGTILRYIWPAMTRCPDCGGTDYTESGSYGKTIRFRYCANPKRPNCPRRTNTYKVHAIAVHIDLGGDQSEIRPI